MKRLAILIVGLSLCCLGAWDDYGISLSTPASTPTSGQVKIMNGANEQWGPPPQIISGSDDGSYVGGAVINEVKNYTSGATLKSFNCVITANTTPATSPFMAIVDCGTSPLCPSASATQLASITFSGVGATAQLTVAAPSVTVLPMNDYIAIVTGAGTVATSRANCTGVWGQ